MKLTQSLKKKITSLKHKKYRNQYNQYVVEGFKITEEAFKTDQEVHFIVVNVSIAEDRKTKDLFSLAREKSIPIYDADDRDFQKLSSLETPPGILAVIEKKKEFIAEDGSYLILDCIKDPGNLGTIIRTADWFGFENIVIGEGSVDMYNPKVLQSTMGSVFHVHFIQNQNLFSFVRDLKKKGYQIIATSSDGDEEKVKVHQNPFAVIMGSETVGIDKEILKLVDHKYRIKGCGKAESLNVAVATGIVLSKLALK
ncbi:RNA methyltransferase [bacterium]|nr:RNA methyltransferase [bacterium]